MEDCLHFYLEQHSKLNVESDSAITVPDEYSDDVIDEVFQDMTGKKPDTIVPVPCGYKMCVFK